jgi:hypothetical protein
MATDTFVNILDLQPITEVVNGDYLIVETPAGTRIINFKDFILPNTNILLTQTVSDNTTAILSNFTVLNDYIATLSGSINGSNNINYTSLTSVSTLLTTQITNTSSTLQNQITSVNFTLNDSITSNNTNLQTQIIAVSSQLYIGTAVVTIPVGSTNGLASLSPLTTKILTNQNISITPANAYAAKNPAYISNFQSNNIVTLTSPFSGAGTAAADAVYNILAISNS